MESVLDLADTQLKDDIIRIIIQYLQSQGLHVAATTLKDEANVKVKDGNTRSNLMRKMRIAIIGGDWPEVERLINKQAFRTSKTFLYEVYKQQYLELLDDQEHQKAFHLLSKRLKPLEAYQTKTDELKDLAYLLVCKSVQDEKAFRHWDGGSGSSREHLINQFEILLEGEEQRNPDRSTDSLESNRLQTLLKQAACYQIIRTKVHRNISPKLKSLLQDFSPFALPNAPLHILNGHSANVKCLDWLGLDGDYIISGSSDNTIRIWDVAAGSCIATCEGHSSRIWSVAATPKGNSFLSASADGSVRLWDTKEQGDPHCVETYKAASSADLYSVCWHPGQKHFVSASYDRTLRLWDAETKVVVKSFEGHTSSISTCLFSPLGNLVVSGSKDGSIRFWDLASRLNIKTIASHLGEVTSVVLNSGGNLLLSASKDNSNRLWDLRKLKPIMRFKGHQNTSKNFIGASFGAKQEVVIGGSEDGCVYIWSVSDGKVLERLEGHDGVVYSASWNERQCLIASCSHDASVRTWFCDDSQDNEREYGSPSSIERRPAASLNHSPSPDYSNLELRGNAVYSGLSSKSEDGDAV